MPAGVAAVVAIVRVLVPLELGVKLTLVGEIVNVIPVAAGDAVAESATFPVNPRLLRVIVEVAEVPARMLAGEAALAEIVKSPVTVKGNGPLLALVVPLTP